MVEHLLAKEDVASSSLVTRSTFFQFLGRCGALFFESKSHPVCISLPKDDMKTLVLCMCSIVLAVAAVAQPASPTPPAPPTAPSASATASVSPSSNLADKLHQKLDKKLHGRHGIVIDGNDSDLGDLKSGEIPGLVVPIVAITMFTIFGAPVLIVGLIMYFGFSRNRAMHRTIRMLAEKGQPIPAALLAPPTPAVRQRSDIRRGIVLVMVGIGIMICFGAWSDWEGGSWALGVIPFVIGLGYLLVWKLEGEKKNEIPPSPPTS